MSVSICEREICAFGERVPAIVTRGRRNLAYVPDPVIKVLTAVIVEHFENLLLQ